METEKWDVVPKDEQETIIRVDYENKTINFYTNRRSVATRVYKKLGEPDSIDLQDGFINGIRYTRNLNDKNIRAILSLTNIVGNFRHPKI